MKIYKLTNKEFIALYSRKIGGCVVSDYIELNNSLFKRFLEIGKRYIKCRKNYLKSQQQKKRS